MIIKVYDNLPSEAMNIRIKVFAEEQGFIDKPDDTDTVATHVVGYEGTIPVATCRIFKNKEGRFILGRFAVIKEFRGRGFGRELLSHTEKYFADKGVDTLSLHSQYHACGFYRALGYTEIGDVEYEQGEPHVWMAKRLPKI
ncbi:MAG: GNAT family N-acetyltransferase [Ruminococcaceae bacterium]|nr:GNAT family N-acetyltransferase [Oscillospiraceae bacterium]